MLLEKRGTSSKKVINEINVVPYVDIMLVLLVIFMVVTPLAVQGLDINLPNTQADEIELEQSQPFVIDVNENGNYFIEEDGDIVQVSLGFLEDRFQKVVATNPNIEIIVRGDRETSYQAIADLLGVLQANGAKNFSLATQP
ncbi:MAG: biopolymer transporter ExbD [Pseudomonadota bacterium]|jgi:biopolymer transport protein TolR|nr:biopolymer transporter ExbD [SAR86 cluster bacterium]MEC7167060.1 biopolymer transporter ExbD [Pseudomonadota bacterium]MEC7513192.1 biopolymer transporter ExbD [Pseudomonadota bacterium]GIR08831.1 MAG: protein TolR [Gammaproteobacteria bacterium]|tara:strand:- start:107 stop:529 length:423 start_codon:yes stop_codon:yes gene_type:complete